MKTITISSDIATDPPSERLELLTCLFQLGSFCQVLEELSSLLSLYPTSIKLLLLKGASNSKLANYDKAIQVYKAAIKIAPANSELYFNLGNNYWNIRDADQAIKAYTKAIEIKPDYFWAYNNMGLIFQKQGSLDKATASFSMAIEINSNFCEGFNNLGNVLFEEKKYSEAFREYETAIKINPAYAEAHNNLGIILKIRGDFKEAARSFKNAISQNATYYEAYRNLSLLLDHAEIGFSGEILEKMETLSSSNNLSDHDRCHLCFFLAKVYEDFDKLEKSFKYFILGNALRKKILAYDIKDDMRLFKTLKRSYQQLKKNFTVFEKRSSDVSPIFIIGLPRSGTTLVEQIITSHSNIAAAGELAYVDKFGRSLALAGKHLCNKSIDVFRSRYLNLLREATSDETFVTDKMPLNFRYLGFLYLCFPEAKFIHVSRSASATCWSNFTQYFSTTGFGFCYNLEDLVKYHKIYTSLMEFWYQHCGARIYELSYDKLVEDQESETKLLIEFLGLKWEVKCLAPEDNLRFVDTASNVQVRKRVYGGSSKRWLKFKKYLEGAFDSL